MSLISSTPSGNEPIQHHFDLESSIQKEEGRIFSLDVIRGFALLGILVISVREFGGFTTNQQLYYQTGTHGGNYKLMSIISMLFEGKMRALFALVFGAGIILFLRKKEHPVPIGTPDAYIRRMLWLMAFGLFNAFILLWPGDILFQYGVMGILLYAFNRMKAKGLLIAALVCCLIYCGKQYWNYADDKKDHRKYTAVIELEKKFKLDSTTRAKKDSLARTGDTVLLKDSLIRNKLNDSLAKKNDTLTTEQSGDKEKWKGRVKSLKYDSASTARTNKLMRSVSWRKIAYQQMMKTQQKESWWLYQIGIWDIGSMMLLGMALLSIGFFTGRFSSSKHILIAVVCLVIGLALAWYRIHFNSMRVSDYEKFIVKHPIPFNQFFPFEILLLATGYASLIIGLLRLRIFSWVWKALALMGKMAFSNYFLQTILCTFFFYGYGFGFFGRLTQCELYFFVAEMALIQIAFSVFWLRFYKMGPVEWLWRCLVYKTWLPNKKKNYD